MNSRRSMRRPEDAATPALLPIFLAATLAVVGAVAAIGLTDSDWADVGAVALLLGMLALVIGAIWRQLRDDEPASADRTTDGSSERSADQPMGGHTAPLQSRVQGLFDRGAR